MDHHPRHYPGGGAGERRRRRSVLKALPSPPGGSPLLTSPQDQPLRLVDHPEQVFDLYVLDKLRVLPVEEDARAQAIVEPYYDPGGDAHLPYLRSGIVAHDQVGTERRRLPVEGLRIGEAHIVVGALFSEDERERLSVHGGCYGDQYAHDDLLGAPLQRNGPVPTYYCYYKGRQK